MSLYSERILPHAINYLCSLKPNMKQREKIVPQAAGDVLEVGFGSGLNLPYYDADRVRKVWALEPSEGMRQKSRPLIEQSTLDVEFIDLPGEQIPLDDASVDTVLVTYTLCTIEDTVQALEGMRRVLKPGGQLLFCEHGLAPDANVQKWQTRLNPVWTRVAGGCRMDRNIPALIDEGGFTIKVDERMYIPGPKILCYNYWGSAVAA
ncbi:MAG: class I SAM-dependent methyltransferase [Woeseiaceae bacterium]|nr:class I SAM-dependent methyltransferase [Woeseiaceae bacterium]